MKPFVNSHKDLNRIIFDEDSWKSTRVDEGVPRLHTADEYDSFHFRTLFGTYSLWSYENNGVNSQNVSFYLIF